MLATKPLMILFSIDGTRVLPGFSISFIYTYIHLTLPCFTPCSLIMNAYILDLFYVLRHLKASGPQKMRLFSETLNREF